MPENYVKVHLANGATDAVMIKLFLESLGIPAEIFEESAGIIYGLTVGPLAETEIWVPADKAEEAIELLQKMESGELGLPMNESLEVPPELENLAEENRRIIGEENSDQAEEAPEGNL